MCVTHFVAAKTDADKCAAAIANHNSNSQCNYRQWKYHRVGCVAVGAEITGVGDKYLINDIVERRYHERDYSGYGVFQHQPPYGFGFKKGIVFISPFFLLT